MTRTPVTSSIDDESSSEGTDSGETGAAAGGAGFISGIILMVLDVGTNGFDRDAAGLAGSIGATLIGKKFDVTSLTARFTETPL